jgi:hypothetical protein
MFSRAIYRRRPEQRIPRRHINWWAVAAAVAVAADAPFEMQLPDDGTGVRSGICRAANIWLLRNGAAAGTASVAVACGLATRWAGDDHKTFPIWNKEVASSTRAWWRQFWRACCIVVVATD